MEKTLEELIEGFTPLGNQIVVKRAEVKTQTASGLFIPAQAQDKPARGVALKVGLGLKNGFNGEVIKPVIEEGDELLYYPHAINEIDTGDGKIPCVHEGDILGFWRQ